MVGPRWREKAIKAFVEVGIECEEAQDVIWMPSYHHYEIYFTYFCVSKRYVVGFLRGGVRYTYKTYSFDEAYKVVLRYVFEGVKPKNL